MRVYGAEDCQACTTLTRKLDREGVDYEYFDVGRDAKAHDYLRDNGQASIPVVETENEMFYGMDARRLRHEIEQQQARTGPDVGQSTERGVDR